jgi:hypothetical protein
MDNKYGLGGAKVATEHHEAHHKNPVSSPTHCKHCGGEQLMLCLTMHDHRCVDCDEWQGDIPQGYSTGRSGHLE